MYRIKFILVFEVLLVFLVNIRLKPNSVFTFNKQSTMQAHAKQYKIHLNNFNNKTKTSK